MFGVAKMTRKERKTVLLKEMKASISVLQELTAHCSETATSRITNLLAGIILYLETEDES
jgi:GTP cyclohydrolase II